MSGKTVGACRITSKEMANNISKHSKNVDASGDGNKYTATPIQRLSGKYSRASDGNLMKRISASELPLPLINKSIITKPSGYEDEDCDYEFGELPTWVDVEAMAEVDKKKMLGGKNCNLVQKGNPLATAECTRKPNEETIDLIWQSEWI